MKPVAGVFAVAVGLLAVCPDAALPQSRVDSRQPIPKMLERPNVARFEEPSIAPGAEVVALELTWEKRDPQEATRRLRAAIEAILGGEADERVSKETSYDALSAAVTGKEAGTWVRLANTPILAMYDAQYDEIRVLDEDLDLLDKPARDIGIEGARDVAERILKPLAEARVIDSRLYHQAAVQVGLKVVGEGPVDKEVQPGRIVGYRVTYRPRLNGFQLVNAGLRVGVAASGEVASLRVGGVTPLGEWRGGVLKPTGAGGARKVRVSTKELTERFYRQAPKGTEPRIAWSRVMYVMPEAKSRAVLEPMLVISYTLVRKAADSQVASRRKTLAYSLTDPKAPPIDFDAPAARHEGTEVTRKN